MNGASIAFLIHETLEKLDYREKGVNAMTRVPPLGSSSSGTFLITPPDLRDTAPTFTSASKLTFEQELILDSLTESVIGELKLLQSLAQLAEALQNFKERVSEIMHCVGNNEAVVGEALEEAALSADFNESFTGGLFKEPGPGFQPLPGIFPIPKPVLPPISTPKLPTPGIPGLKPLGPEPLGPELLRPETLP